ncbi:MAG TPA: hypothetical protein VHB50_22980 [Bryobacteraceae bacterium]|nr:hypothetical protein [Bryobacteraceae bacterium]
MKSIALFLLCSAMLVAQRDPHPSAVSERPVTLYSGMGTWRHPIETRSPLAQKYFDQGLALVYGFNRYEGLRSFRKAAELDPQAPMAYWGISFALAPYINMDGDPSVDIKESCGALDKGLALKEASATERAYLEAAATRCPDFSDPQRYVRAARDLASRYPDDPDAQVLYAESLMIPTRWHWYSGDGTPAEGVAEAERVLEGVLRRNPAHPGANHFYIHAVESSPTPERAIASSERLMGIVPGAGHVVHMPAHIWLVLGDFETAATVNQRAAEVDRKYFVQTGVNGSYYMYYLHNLDFILYARMMQGRLTETRKAAAQLREAAAPMIGAMPEMAGLFDAIGIMSELRSYRWNDLIAAPRPTSKNPTSVAMWHYARAFSLASKGQTDEAKQESEQFERSRSSVDRDAPWIVNKTGDILDLAAATLAARLASSPVDAVPLWQKAVALQDALTYDEPPAWHYPIRESLGAALLRAGDASGAETVFREGLRRSPRNGRMLFGLLESLKAQNKAGAVAWVQREFDAAWKGADIELRLSDL